MLKKLDAAPVVVRCPYCATPLEHPSLSEVLAAIELQPAPRQVLDLMMKRAGRVVTREALIDHIWGLLPECDQPKDPDAVLKVHAAKIRAGLPDWLVLRTHWGVGYSLRLSDDG